MEVNKAPLPPTSAAKPVSKPDCTSTSISQYSGTDAAFHDGEVGVLQFKKPWTAQIQYIFYAYLQILRCVMKNGGIGGTTHGAGYGAPLLGDWH